MSDKKEKNITLIQSTSPNNSYSEFLTDFRPYLLRWIQSYILTLSPITQFPDQLLFESFDQFSNGMDPAIVGVQSSVIVSASSTVKCFT